MNNEAMKLVQEAAWEEAKGYLEAKDEKSLKEQIDNETKIMCELADDVACEQRKSKKLKIALIGVSVAAVVGGTILYSKGKKAGVVKTSKTPNPIYEIYKEGICAFIDDKSGHLVSTIEVTNPDDYKALSDEAYEYFKDTIAMLAAGND